MTQTNHPPPAFTTIAPLLRVRRTTLLLQPPSIRTPRPTVPKKSRAPLVPNLCVENKEEEQQQQQQNVKQGLTITRQEILQRTRSGRAARLRRRATLSEIDVPAAGDTTVDVWIVISRDRRDFRVRGKVTSQLLRTCDRCAKEYIADTDGRFDVILRTGDAKSEDDEAELVEAVEQFGPGVGEVWLGDHVRDGVYLGVPTRSLCSDDCSGVEVPIKPDIGSVQYKIGDSHIGGPSGGEKEDFVRGLGKREAAERLMELKRRLEKQGL